MSAGHSILKQAEKERSEREFQTLKGALEKTTTDVGPQDFGLKIETWKGDPKATFVIPDPAGILHVSGLVWCKRRRVTTQWVLYPGRR